MSSTTPRSARPPEPVLDDPSPAKPDRCRSELDCSDMLYEIVADGIAQITIDRPDVRNAIDMETAQQLAAALDRFDADEQARVGVLTGAGGMFCAGMDLKAISAGEPRPMTTRGMFGICERPPDKPLIAAVERFALGGGLEIALACDLIVAAEDAKLGLPEAKRGLVAAAGGVIRLPRRIPPAVAMELALTGDTLPVARAYELGLVNLVTAAGKAIDGALEIAGRIAANAPLATATAKKLINASADWQLDQAFEHQLPLVQAVRDSDDAREGAKAFVEKRPPVWTGR
jgi:enoyl-CoA hydratase